MRVPPNDKKRSDKGFIFCLIVLLVLTTQTLFEIMKARTTILLILSFNLLLISCLSGNRTPIYFEALDIDSSKEIGSGHITHRQYLPDPNAWMGWGPRPSQRDTIEHKLGIPLYFHEFIARSDEDCLHEVNYLAEGYFSLFTYNINCLSDGIETFVFEMKPTMEANITISTEHSLRFLSVETLLLDNVQEGNLNSNFRIDKFSANSDLSEILSSQDLSLNLVQRAMVRIRTVYRITDVHGTFETDTIINTSNEPSLQVNIFLP